MIPTRASLRVTRTLLCNRFSYCHPNSLDQGTEKHRVNADSILRKKWCQCNTASLQNRASCFSINFTCAYAPSLVLLRCPPPPPPLPPCLDHNYANRSKRRKVYKKNLVVVAFADGHHKLCRHCPSIMQIFWTRCKRSYCVSVSEVHSPTINEQAHPLAPYKFWEWCIWRTICQCYFLFRALSQTWQIHSQFLWRKLPMCKKRQLLKKKKSRHIYNK